MHRFFHQTSVPSGVLSIGMVETINQLPDLLSAYCSRYPQVDLSLTAGVTERLLQHVLDVELDGAFVTGPISHRRCRSRHRHDDFAQVGGTAHG
ncbi:LysR substrate-binding domain-containing protein [Brevibacillus agri]|uniref:LysR substrate-binding domain-containing protein n=1 Tax=Brevibacillus agri TaxID=51101 RepID=UPI0025B7033B|nr:LysR substrate-binding domain-containing protein [Brevibacillus agri]MDN4095679.1 LysR substrate-binding domain-containing protein [Brevibacillus agri]